MKSNTSASARYCPLCAGDNACAVVQGLPPQDCWCMHTPISAEALALAQGKRSPDAAAEQCICERCGTALQPETPEVSGALFDARLNEGSRAETLQGNQ